MRGLVFDFSIPKYVLAKGLGQQFPSLHYGKGSCLALKELPSPALPGPGWVRLRPLMAGMCGSDLATIFFKFSPQLEPFGSFPCVLGHEVLAEVVDPAGARDLVVGQRVAVDPLLPCRLRGFSPCAGCASGFEGACERTTEGCLAPGGLIGFTRDLPGGMSTEMVAHSSQLHPVPSTVTDDEAVLIEPLSVSLHAILRTPPRDHERVLVIGGGPIAFATVWAIRALGLKCQVTLLAREAYQLEVARRFGADDALLTSAEDVQQAEEVARRTGGRVHRPTIGPPVVTGGYELVIDCVGSTASVTDALRYARSLGRVLLVGAAGILDRVDWTAIWHRELAVVGAYTYGRELFRGQPIHTFDLALQLLAAREAPDVAPMITHRFKLSEYARAIEANVARGKHQALKTVFDLREER